MALQKSNIVWDDEKHPTVHLGMTNHDGETDAAYLRKVVEFYETNKAGATFAQRIFEELITIKSIMRGGLVIGTADSDASSDDTDDIFDDLLGQME